MRKIERIIAGGITFLHHTIDLGRYSIEKKYVRNNRHCFFDPSRQILVVENPEEIVRQKLLLYLQDKMSVPLDKIHVEKPMTHFKKGARGRADIIVYGIDEENVLRPILVVECKAPNIPLTDDVYDQVVRYNEILGADNLLITNGVSLVFWSFDGEMQSFRPLSKIPQYRQLVERQNLIFDTSEKYVWQRPAFSHDYDETVEAEFRELGWIGEDTPSSLRPFLINFIGFLQDDSKKLSPQVLSGIKIIEDGGNRFTSFGNAAGGNWTGDYRFFIIEDKEGNNQIVSISVFAGFKCENDPVFGNRKGETCLVVAIDDFDKRHNSLQLNLDNYILVNTNNCSIWHDGKITVGKTGACKRQEVIDFIRRTSPELLNGKGEVFLGTFDNSRAISWSQKTTVDFIGRLIKYALVRDQFRKYKQSNMVDKSVDSSFVEENAESSNALVENGAAEIKKPVRKKRVTRNLTDAPIVTEVPTSQSYQNKAKIVMAIAASIILITAVVWLTH